MIYYLSEVRLKKQPQGQAGKEHKDSGKPDGKKSTTKNNKGASGGGNGEKLITRSRNNLATRIGNLMVWPLSCALSVLP